MATSPYNGAVSLRYTSETAVLALNAPKLNAFSGALVDDLEHVLRALNERPARCVILTGGPRAFSVGARLDELRAMTTTEKVDFNGRLVSAFDRVARLAAPTIAAIHGYALGGGLELALACTFRIAATETQLGLPEAKLGLLPGAGGTQRLPRTIGYGPALRLLLTGESVSAKRALGLGLIDEVADDPVDAALALAGRIASSGPLAVRAITDVVAECRALPVSEAIARTELVLAELLDSRDATEGLAASAEKRRPLWSGA